MSPDSKQMAEWSMQHATKSIAELHGRLATVRGEAGRIEREIAELEVFVGKMKALLAKGGA